MQEESNNLNSINEIYRRNGDGKKYPIIAHIVEQNSNNNSYPVAHAKKKKNDYTFAEKYLNIYFVDLRKYKKIFLNSLIGFYIFSSIQLIFYTGNFLSFYTIIKHIYISTFESVISQISVLFMGGLILLIIFKDSIKKNEEDDSDEEDNLENPEENLENPEENDQENESNN